MTTPNTPQNSWPTPVPLRLYIALHATEQDIAPRTNYHSGVTREQARLNFADEMLKTFERDEEMRELRKDLKP